MGDTFSDRVVLITGPARGIGAGTARALAARGARLALVGLEPALLAALAAELGPAHRWWECDVTDSRALERAVAEAVHEMGRIDVVVANAGIASHGTVAVTPADALARTVDVNLGGVVRTVSATLPHLIASRGYLLLVSSAAALAPSPVLATYCATKAGVEMFGNALRLEVARHGVQVGLLHPSWIDTDMVRDPRSDLPSFDVMLAMLPGPLGRVTPLDECVAAVVDAIAHRRRKVFVPASLAPFSWLRQLLVLPFVERLVERRARTRVADAEREVRALGRAFGVHSVEHRNAP